MSKLLFKVINPNKCWHEFNLPDEEFSYAGFQKCRCGLRIQNPQAKVNPDYKKWEDKGKLLEWLAKENPDWWREFKREKLSRGNVTSEQLFTSPTFIPDLEQFLARWILERKDEECPKCNGKGEYPFRDEEDPNPQHRDGNVLCECCGGHRTIFSYEIVAAAEEVLK